MHFASCKENCDCEVFIRAVDKHYSLMQFCREAFLSLLDAVYLLETRKMVATGKDFILIDYNGLGAGHSLI